MNFAIVGTFLSPHLSARQTEWPIMHRGNGFFRVLNAPYTERCYLFCFIDSVLTGKSNRSKARVGVRVVSRRQPNISCPLTGWGRHYICVRAAIWRSNRSGILFFRSRSTRIWRPQMRFNLPSTANGCNCYSGYYW